MTELKRRRAELPAFELQSVIRNATGRIVSRADVAFPAQRLAVYCDGAAYHLNRQQWQKDLRQRRELGQMRWRFVAFTGSEITTGPAACVEDILRDLRAHGWTSTAGEAPPSPV